MVAPEAKARETIDAALSAAGWVVQDYEACEIDAALGVAVREYPLQKKYGTADYLLYVDGSVVGVVEAKKVGTTLTGVETQAERYSVGLPAVLPAKVRPLPFLYQSTGVETRFTNGLDPEPRSREVFTFHRPETLRRWIEAEAVAFPLRQGKPDPRSQHPGSILTRLQAMPVVAPDGLRPAQFDAVAALEKSLARGDRRALVQMATGAGKTILAIAETYRLLKFANAQRVLFLVDRNTLAKQAEEDFQGWEPPDDPRRFTEIYTVQRLRRKTMLASAQVVITTIQRLFARLRGEELPADEDADPGDDKGRPQARVTVEYNPDFPIESFDLIFVDECHRSIYTDWGQVLTYFDAPIVGLTATPSKHTLAFFHKNLVSEYPTALAVRDKVNVQCNVYRIRTKITEQGATIEAVDHPFVPHRDRRTRKVRWLDLDDDLDYDADALDRTVVAKDQIRTVLTTFRDRLFTDIFPGRAEVPKTLIFAKDDAHADDIVDVTREVFGKGNEFAEKITYLTGVSRIVMKVTEPDGSVTEKVEYKTSNVTADDHLSAFRNSYNPRIVVTVDKIGTGTDIRPLEVVMFMRAVRSRVLFEQMRGRGVRVIEPEELKAVTPSASLKEHYVLVDCVGVTDHPLTENEPLDRHRSVSFGELLQRVGGGSLDSDTLATLAARLDRFDRRLSNDDRAVIAKTAGGLELKDIVAGIINALDVDRQVEHARAANDLADDATPTDAQVDAAAAKLLKDAAGPLRKSAALRTLLLSMQQASTQVIDEVSLDEVLHAGFDEGARQRAEETVRSFEGYIKEHHGEITALQVLYSGGPGKRLRYSDVKALAKAIAEPPRRWSTDALWAAYAALDRNRVQGASGKRLLTDLVALVRFALKQNDVLRPFPETVEARFTAWMAQQEQKGRRFTDEQRSWLSMIRDHVASSLEVTMEDLDYAPFIDAGGADAAWRAFGNELEPLMQELAEALAA